MKIQITLLVILLLSATTMAKYSGGSGEPNNPYRIATPNDLNSIGLDANDWDKHFLMTADINMAGFSGTQFNIIATRYDHFVGVFDGNDHLVSRFTYICPDGNFIGLFASVGSSGKVRNLILQGVNVSGSWLTGGLAGINNGMISDCDVHGVVSGTNDTGGLVGINFGMISDCDIHGIVSGANDTGGLVGGNYETISRCHAIANTSAQMKTGGLVGDNHGVILDSTATGSIYGDDYTAGLVGDNSGVILGCHSAGSVDGTSVTGGLVGENNGLIGEGLISCCYATANVSGYDLVGGLVGWNVYGTVSKCYATGHVSGDNGVGGLVGWNVMSAVSDCYAAGAVNANDHFGGFIGENADSTITACFWDIESSGQSDSDGDEIGKTTTEMQRRATFADAGWDMVNVWDIGENQTYPFLRTHLPSDINKDGETNLYDLAILAQNWLAE